MSDPESAERRASLAAAPLLLIAPFLAFAKHHGYSLWAPELLASASLFVGTGLLIGAAMALGGKPARCVGIALLLALITDIQGDWEEEHGFRALALIAAAALALAALLRRHVALIGATAAGALTLAVLAGPGGDARLQSLDLSGIGAGAQALPPLLHLVLDEHIGVEGIPSQYDPGNRAAERTRSFYTERGFRVFGRAYSRYYHTSDSLRNLFGLRREAPAPDPGLVAPRLEHNAYFDALRRRGYRIHVIQSDYLDFCGSGEPTAVDSCFTYSLETADVLRRTSLSSANKLRALLGIYARTSLLLTTLVEQTGLLEDDRVLRPRGKGQRVSSLSAMHVLDQLIAAPPRLENGNVVFVHLLLPHSPYAFDARCRLRKSPSQWLWSRTAGISTRRRYQRYLEQIGCVERKLGILFDAWQGSGDFERARILVHGDHGARIALNEPTQLGVHRMKPSVYTDAFSTLYAHKEPGRPGGYERAQFALDELFESWLDPRRTPDMETAPQVFLRGPSSLRAARPMPEFGLDWNRAAGSARAALRSRGAGAD